MCWHTKQLARRQPTFSHMCITHLHTLEQTNSEVCYSCVAPLKSPEGASSCGDCQPGFYVADVTQCMGCGAGSISQALNAANCTVCPDGKQADSTGTNCTQCSSGYACSGGVTQPCEAGYAAAAGATECTSCDNGESVGASIVLVSD